MNRLNKMVEIYPIYMRFAEIPVLGLEEVLVKALVVSLVAG